MVVVVHDDGVVVDNPGETVVAMLVIFLAFVMDMKLKTEIEILI